MNWLDLTFFTIVLWYKCFGRHVEIWKQSVKPCCLVKIYRMVQKIAPSCGTLTWLFNLSHWNVFITDKRGYPLSIQVELTPKSYCYACGWQKQTFCLSQCADFSQQKVYFSVYTDLFKWPKKRFSHLCHYRPHDQLAPHLDACWQSALSTN